MFKNKFKTLIFSLGIFLALMGIAALTTYNGTFTGTFIGNGSGITNVVSPQTVYVSPSGNDVNPGTLNSPLLTFTNPTVMNILSNGGLVILRGGNYTNESLNVAGLRGTIEGFAGEVPTNWYGSFISSNSFVSTGANGFFTNSPNAAFSNALITITNLIVGQAYNLGMPIFQIGLAYGSQGSNNYYSPPLLMSDDGVTNRCFNFPLAQAFTAPSTLTTSNGYWAYTNGVLVVKPAVSGTMTDLLLSSTNLTDCFIYGGNALTHLTVRNVFSIGGYRCFDGSGCGWLRLEDCLGYGGLFGSFSSASGGARHIDLITCEFVAGLGNNVDFGQGYASFPCIVLMDNCYTHDTMQIGVHFGQNIHALVRNCYHWGGTNEQGAWISDGATVRWEDSEVANNRAFTMQMGVSIPLGHKTYMLVHNIWVQNYGNLPFDGIRMDDQNDTLNAVDNQFYMAGGGTAINPQGVQGTQNAQGYMNAYVSGVGQIQLNGIIGAGFGNPQFSDNAINFGSVTPIGAMYFDGVGAGPDGVISDTRIRSTTGYNMQVGGHGVTVINSSGAFLSPGGITITNGYASFETNTLTVTATGLTNNTTVDYLIAITAGTGLVLKDQNGTQFLTPVLNASYPLKPGWKLTGTLVTGTAIQYP